jgi:hypothetical protein
MNPARSREASGSHRTIRDATGIRSPNSWMHLNAA